nr:2-oxoglutarate (2OG) and Fe(II)-dependent oxygenase superfamily protein [Tanacetum cinerariifolium]
MPTGKERYSRNPQSPTFPSNEFSSNVLNCVPSGILPTKRLCERRKTARPLMPARLSGISLGDTLQTYCEISQELEDMEMGISLQKRAECSGYPQSPTFHSNEFSSNVLNYVPSGIRPTRQLCERRKTAKPLMPAMLFGICPVSWFQDRSNDSISERFPRQYGILLLRAFIFNLGDMMKRWTNSIFRSTLHRVMPTEKERYSFFGSGYPQSPTFPSNEFSSNVLNCVPSGIRPTRRLYERRKTAIPLMPARL